MTSAYHAQSKEHTGSQRIHVAGITKIKRLILNEICQKLIDAGERNGWTMEADSIDSKPVMDINVFNHEVVYSPEIYTIVEPYLPILKMELDDRFPELPNQLYWICFRKYQAGAIRQALLGHRDACKHTINLALNSNFEEGRLYFIPPDSEFGKLANAPENSKLDLTPLLHGVCPENVPLKEQGDQSNYFFPDMLAGVPMVYDSTIWHGVTPVTKGTRYTLSFLYDETPEIRGEAEGLSGSVQAIFENKRTIKSGVVLYWIPAPEETVSCDPGAEGDHFINPDSDVEVSKTGAWVESIAQNTYIGHVFAAVETRSNRILVVWRISQESELFTLTDDHKGNLSYLKKV